jgi:hypothetical protein
MPEILPKKIQLGSNWFRRAADARVCQVRAGLQKGQQFQSIASLRSSISLPPLFAKNASCVHIFAKAGLRPNTKTADRHGRIAANSDQVMRTESPIVAQWQTRSPPPEWQPTAGSHQRIQVAKPAIDEDRVDDDQQTDRPGMASGTNQVSGRQSFDDPQIVIRPPRQGSEWRRSALSGLNPGMQQRQARNTQTMTAAPTTYRLRPGCRHTQDPPQRRSLRAIPARK